MQNERFGAFCLRSSSHEQSVDLFRQKKINIDIEMLKDDAQLLTRKKKHENERMKKKERS